MLRMHRNTQTGNSPRWQPVFGPVDADWSQAEALARPRNFPILTVPYRIGRRFPEHWHYYVFVPVHCARRDCLEQANTAGVCAGCHGVCWAGEPPIPADVQPMPESVTNAFRRALIGGLFLPQVSQSIMYGVRLVSIQMYTQSGIQTL